MYCSHSEASRHQPLDNSQTNNPNNYGLIGDGSNDTIISNNIVNSRSNTVNFGSYNFINSGINSGPNNFVNPGIIILDDSEDIELDELLNGHISKDALHNSFHSPPKCHPNTRTTVCKEIGEWIADSESTKSPLLWLNGPPASGKSVIAKTISGFHGQVVATFFFSSSNRSATTLFPTLAWQLARRIPDTRKHIIASLKNRDLLRATRIEEQFDLLIIQPLKRTTTLGSCPVMVIDGVDQCTDEMMLVWFLRVLVQAGERGGMPLRFIICSRPESRICAILGDHEITNSSSDRVPHLAFPSPQVCTQWSQGFTQFLQDVWELYRPTWLGVDKDAPFPSDTCVDALDKICPHPVISTIQIGFSEECKEDITRYLTDKLSAIRQPGAIWFQPSEISYLVKVSCGIFLYASTIVRLLDEPHFGPKEVLEMARRGSLPIPDLDKQYTTILERAQNTIRNNAEEGRLNYQTEWRFVMDSMAILVFLAGNDHFYTARKISPVIESLLDLEKGRLITKLRKLHSVLRVVPEEFIWVHHRSFLEFLQSRERSGEYHISSSTALRRMLILMGRAGLRYLVFK